MYDWRVHPTTLANFRTQSAPVDDEDREWLGVEATSHRHPTLISTEADVTSRFDENIVVYLKQAFTGFPYVSFPAGHGPGYSGSPNIYADFSTMYKHAHVTIGECKKPGVIREEHWTDPRKANWYYGGKVLEILGRARDPTAPTHVSVR